MHFPEWKFWYFDSNFTEVCSQRSIWQWGSICLSDGLALNRRQAIIWTNVDLIVWRIYAALGGDELSLWCNNRVCVSSHIPCFLWGIITNQCQNFNCNVSAWMSNSFTIFYVITYPWPDTNTGLANPCNVNHFGAEARIFQGYFKVIPWLLMPWYGSSPGHQQVWYSVGYTGPLFYIDNISMTCAFSMLRNDRKCKYTFFFYQLSYSRIDIRI